MFEFEQINIIFKYKTHSIYAVNYQKFNLMNELNIYIGYIRITWVEANISFL